MIWQLLTVPKYQQPPQKTPKPMKRQVHYFLTAVLFFTRIPCPSWVDHSPDYINKSSRYFSLVGILIGAISGLLYWLSTQVFDNDISVLISMISSVWITGAFHEDGFADVCDGFGGGWTKAKILTIMKDSTLGTFGVLGLLFIIALKFLALYKLSTLSTVLPFILIAGHSLSRFAATLLLYTHPYVRDNDSSKIKPTTKQMSTKALIISGFFGLAPLLLLENTLVYLSLLPVLLCYLYLGRLYTKWIGGQTGDCAGALQQVAEVVFYLSLVALWKYI